MRSPGASAPRARVYCRNWTISAITLAAGTPALSIAADRQFHDVTRSFSANDNDDWVALEAQRTASFGLEYMADGSYFTGPLLAGNGGQTCIDHLARLPPAGYVHRSVLYKAVANTPSTLAVQDSTRGSEIFITSSYYFRPPDDDYNRRIISRGTDLYWAFNRNTLSTTEQNQGWNTNSARTAVPQVAGATSQQTSLIPCSYGHSFLITSTQNVRCSVLASDDLSAMTLQYWFKPLSTFTGNTNAVGNPTGPSHVGTDSSGNLIVVMGGVTRITSLAPLVIGTTYMVTVVNNAGTAYLYIDAVLQGSYASAFAPVNASNFVYVNTGNANMNFQSLSIAKIVVSDADILADYAAGISDPE